jgi:hypothetical protein
LRDHRRDALPQDELHLRPALHEVLDDRPQHIARVHVGGGDHQPAAAFLGELLGDALEIVSLPERALRHADDGLAGRGQPEDAVAAADQEIDTELGLQHPDLPTDSGL